MSAPTCIAGLKHRFQNATLPPSHIPSSSIDRGRKFVCRQKRAYSSTRLFSLKNRKHWSPSSQFGESTCCSRNTRPSSRRRSRCHSSRSKKSACMRPPFVSEPMLLAGLSVASTLSHKNARAAFARPSAGALSAVVLVVLVHQARLGMSMSRRCSLCVVAQLEGSTSAGCGTAIWSNVITRCEGRKVECASLCVAPSLRFSV